MTVLKVIPQTGCEQVETVVCGNSLCPLKIEEICEDKEKTVSALIQGRLWKWTEHSILTLFTEGDAFNPNNVTQTDSNFIKLKENTGQS